MTKKIVKKIVKGITDKIECNTADIDDWAEFWGFTREEYEEFLDMAIKASEQEPCGDAVSRQAINELQKYRYNCGDTTITCISLASINELPSVTHKTGHWIKIKPYPLQMHDYECSECGHETDDNTENYCSECGAKMEVSKYEC